MFWKFCLLVSQWTNYHHYYNWRLYAVYDKGEFLHRYETIYRSLHSTQNTNEQFFQVIKLFVGFWVIYRQIMLWKFWFSKTVCQWTNYHHKYFFQLPLPESRISSSPRLNFDHGNQSSETMSPLIDSFPLINNNPKSQEEVRSFSNNNDSIYPLTPSGKLNMNVGKVLIEPQKYGINAYRRETFSRFSSWGRNRKMYRSFTIIFQITQSIHILLLKRRKLKLIVFNYPPV